MEVNREAPAFVRDEILVHAPPEKVWAVHTAIDSWPEWRPDVSRARLEGSLAVGSVFRWRSRGLNIVSEIRELEPERRISWTGEAFGTRVVHAWTFTPREDGVLVATQESMEGWLVSLMSGRMQRFLAESIKIWLENLKREAEGGA